MIFFSDPGARRPSRQRKAHRMYEGAPKRRAARPLVAREPLRERWPGGRLALPVQLAREVAEQPVAVGDDVVLVDRFEVLLPVPRKALAPRCPRRSTAMRTISRTQSSTNRGRRWAFSTMCASSG